MTLFSKFDQGGQPVSKPQPLSKESVASTVPNNKISKISDLDKKPRSGDRGTIAGTGNNCRAEGARSAR
jgi:hypothetical protein